MPPARAPSRKPPPTPASAEAEDVFTDTVERILSAAEGREGHLIEQDLDALTQLCTQQQASLRSLNGPLGFADVDVSWTAQLMEGLQRLVTIASSIDFVQAGYQGIQACKEGDEFDSIEAWMKVEGQPLAQKLSMGLEAAAVLLFIMNSPGVDRTVISEDAIEATVVLFRHHLSKNMLPSLNQVGHITAAIGKGGEKSHATHTPSTTSAKKRRRSSTATTPGDQSLVRDMKKVYVPIRSTVGLTVRIMERLEALVHKVPLDDQPLLNISSGALFSLEFDPVVHADVSVTTQIHEAAIALITAIFRTYPRHRQILIEDLFPVMLKLPSYKISMRTIPVQSSSILYPTGLKTLSKGLTNVEPGWIQTITALILSMVQSAVVSPRINISPHDESDANDDTGNEQMQATSGLMGCQSVSDLFVSHLLRRCSKKAEDGGASEFRPILANLLDDLIMVLLVPEYPAAEMLLMTLANRISHEILDLVNGSKTGENTYLNTILDTFGKICAAEARILKVHREHPVRIDHSREWGCYCGKAREKQNVISCDRCKSQYHASCVGLSASAMTDDWYCDACQMARIVDFERERNGNMGESGCSPELLDESYCMRRLLIDYLSITTRKSGLVGLQYAYEFQLARWWDEISQKSDERESGPSTTTTTTTPGRSPLLMRLLELWDPRESSDLIALGQNSLNGMLHCLSDEGRTRIMLHVAGTQSRLLVSHRSQVALFVNQLIGNKKNAMIRKLALKAIEKVTDADPKLMIYPFVRHAVTKRFSDDAISVREAAVSLVGQYVVNAPAVANAFHQAFMIGLQDEGVSVRKRTIKILQDILCSNPSYKGRAEACTAMLRLAGDPKEDDSVRDAIHGLFLKVWLDTVDESVVQSGVELPESPDVEKSPSSPRSNVREREDASVRCIAAVTPGSVLTDQTTPLPQVRTMRSTERRVKKRRLQIRSEIAAEQMVEVVKTADTGEHLTILFRDLLDGESDSHKGRKTSSRQRKRNLEDGHCSLLVDSVFEILLRVEESRAESEIATAKDVVAVMRTIGVFTNISPADVHRHLDTLLPYLKADNGMNMDEEAVVVASLCDVLARVAPILSVDELDELTTTSLSDDLVNITYRFGREALSSSVRALCALAHHQHVNENSPFRCKILNLAKTFYGYLLKHRDEAEFATMKSKAKTNIQRALSVLGAISRFHEASSGDEELVNTEGEAESIRAEDLTFSNLTAVFEKLFTTFLSKNETQIKCAALRGLCGVFISRPREMLRMDQTGLISQVMATNSPVNLQLESLICWRDILLTEESRIESGDAKRKMDSKKNITDSEKISGDQDADATLFGGILTSHASRLLQLTQAKDKRLRFAALDLVGHLLRQGQINPNETVPYLLSLQGDVEEDGIRSYALKLMMIEGEKRPDLLRQRVYAGIKQAYAFQKHVYPTKTHVSALVKIANGTSTQYECVFSRVYKECIANARKQRRGLLSSLLLRFDLQSRKRSNESVTKTASRSADERFIDDLPLLSFTAQVLAHLPYKVASDPLFIMYNINSALALRGPDLLDRFAAFLRQYGLSSSDEMDEANYDEDPLELASKNSSPRRTKNIRRVLDPDFDRTTFSSLCAEAAAQTLLLRLKAFLREAYDFNEARIFGFNPDTREVTEKALSKAPNVKFNSILSMESVQGEGGIRDLDSMICQYAEFRKLMREQSSLGASGVDEDDDDNTRITPQKRRRSLASAMADATEDEISL